MGLREALEASDHESIAACIDAAFPSAVAAAIARHVEDGTIAFLSTDPAGREGTSRSTRLAADADRRTDRPPSH